MSGHAIILDTETTGLNEPDVVQLAYTVSLLGIDDLYEPQMGLHQRMFKPTKPISLGAMATHHIIPEDVVDCQPWPGKWEPPAGVEYLIGYNVDFDWKAIGSPHIARIDVLALARAALPDLDSHTLSAMVYHHALREVAREKLKRAHNASADVQLCHFVLVELLKTLPAMTSWHQLWLASEKARVPERMAFGKYGPHEAWAKANGGAMRCAEVRRRDPGYFSWLMNKCDQVREDPYLEKALRGEAA